MTQASAPWRWGFLIVAIVLGLFLTAVADARVWDWIGVFEMEPLFADWMAILASGDAHRVGLDPYRPNPLDPMGRPHVYGPWWLAISYLGFTRADNAWMGALLVLVFLGVSVALLRPRTGLGAAAAILLLCSGPFMLAMERANNDLLMVILLAAAGWAATRERSGLVLSAAAIVLAAALKIYPLAALPALLAARGRGWRRPALAIGVAVLGCAAIAFFWFEGYRRAMSHVPRPTTIFAYGLSNLWLCWSQLVVWRGHLLAGFLPALAVSAVLLWRARAGLWHLVPLRGGLTFVYVAGACAWLFCFVANTSYPYRAVLWVLCAALWLRQAEERNTVQARAGLYLLGIGLLVVWMSAPKMRLAALSERFGDAGDVYTGGLLALSAAEQALLLVLGLGMIATLTGWAWRWWVVERVPAEA